MFFASVPALRARAVYAPSLRAIDRSVERFMQQAFTVPAVADEAPVSQDDKAYKLVLDLPGIAKEHLDIQIEANQVRITTKPEADRAYRTAYECEGEIDASASQAKLENGVLTLTLAKLAPVTKATQLAVH